MLNVGYKTNLLFDFNNFEKSVDMHFCYPWINSNINKSSSLKHNYDNNYINFNRYS